MIIPAPSHMVKLAAMGGGVGPVPPSGCLGGDDCRDPGRRDHARSLSSVLIASLGVF